MSNSVAAAAVQGTGSDDGGAAAAPVTRTYTCTLGDNTFSVTCGEETQTIGLSGFGGSYGHLQIESLSAAVKIGGSGPQGAVRGTATVAGCVACKVRGHFEGTALRLRVKATGAHPVWEGLELSDLNLAVGEGGVQGGGHAGYTLAGVEGTVGLSWAGDRLVARTTKEVTLPYLGSVTFSVSVDGFDFHFAADTPALTGLSVDNAVAQVTGGRIASDGTKLVGSVSSRLTDLTEVLSGTFDLAVQGLSNISGTGTVTAVLPGTAQGITGTITAPHGESPSLSIPGILLSVADGAVSGTLDLAWTAAEGLSLVPKDVKGTLPGGSELEVVFDQLGYDAVQGLTGSATVPLEALGIDWTAAPGVTGVTGELTAALKDGAVVAGNGVATVQTGFGSVDLHIDAFGESGPEATIFANITNLGPSVSLSEPLVIMGRHAGETTTLQANGLAFAINLGAADLVLSGALGETLLTTSGLTSAVDLALVGGPFGLGTASAKVKDGVVESATFVFPEATFNYPADVPLITGGFSGDLTYDQGLFSGEVTGTADLTGMDDAKEEGAIAFSAGATADGGLEATFEGSNITTPLLIVDRFFLQISGTQVTSDIQVSAPDDLPVKLTGGVQGGWNDGLYLAGGLDISSKDGESPAISGQVHISYDDDNGLAASGGAEVVIDEDAKASAKASIAYADGKLLISAGASLMAVANEPVIDFNLLFGGKNFAWFKKEMDKAMYLPVVGIPYLHGVVGEFGLNLGKAGPTGRISGFYLSASVPEYDLLGDKAPQIEASGGFKNTDFGLALGMGLYLKIIATVYGISIGVKGDVGLQAVLAVKDPSFSSDMTWDEDQDLTGMLDINVPMEFRIEPTAAWGVVAGISKLTVGIPGTGDKWRGEPFLAEALDPLEFSFPWEALMGTMSSETADLDHLGDGPNIQAIKAGATDNNPKLAEMIEFIIRSTQFELRWAASMPSLAAVAQNSVVPSRNASSSPTASPRQSVAMT
ncbi:MAG: hypothetical protein JRJ84_00650, partial [Deltaproteobacteria bacterium]|nr:hypothetical protein [Deltaproteobacteria bacterium]